MARSATWPADPHDHGQAIVGALSALTALAVITIALRFYVRIKVGPSLAAHDWTMLVAVILQIVSQACVGEAYRWGLGAHDANLMYDFQGNFIPSMPWTNITKWVYISTVPGVLASIVARISITLLLISLFSAKRWLKTFLIVATVLVAIAGSLSIIFTWVQASPVEALWNPLIPARRWDASIQYDMVYLAGSIFAFTDLSFALLPIIIIWQLQLPFSRRLGLCILMAGSIFGLICCIMRMLTAARGSLYAAADGMLWAGLEQCLVIILGSAPTLPALRQLNFVEWISTSLSSITGRSLFSSVKTQSKRTTDRRTAVSTSDRSSSDAIKPIEPYEIATPEHGTEMTTTSYQDGVYKMHNSSMV